MKSVGVKGFWAYGDMVRGVGFGWGEEVEAVGFCVTRFRDAGAGCRGLGGRVKRCLGGRVKR